MKAKLKAAFSRRRWREASQSNQTISPIFANTLKFILPPALPFLIASLLIVFILFLLFLLPHWFFSPRSMAKHRHRRRRRYHRRRSRVRRVVVFLVVVVSLVVDVVFAASAFVFVFFSLVSPQNPAKGKGNTGARSVVVRNLICIWSNWVFDWFFSCVLTVFT